MVVAVDPLLQGLGAGAVNADRRVAFGQTHNAPELSLTHPTLGRKHQLTQSTGVLANLFGLAQDQPRLAGGIEHPLARGQHHSAWPLGFGMCAQQSALQIPDLDAPLKDAHQHFGADGCRTGGIAAVIDPHAAVVAHGAHALREVLHAQQGQGLEVWTLGLEHGLHLLALGAVDALGGPIRFPVLQVLVLGLDRFKAFALQGGGLGVADGVLHRALAVGVTHSGGVGHHAVVVQHGRIHGVEFGLV